MITVRSQIIRAFFPIRPLSIQFDEKEKLFLNGNVYTHSFYDQSFLGYSSLIPGLTSFHAQLTYISLRASV